MDVGGHVSASGSATGTTATTSGTGSNTTTLTFTGTTGFANGDVVKIDNAGQDYYTRIVSGGTAASVTVSPAVTFETARTVTKYDVQNVGSDANGPPASNDSRFFQGYFLGGVVTGAGSTTLSDGNLQSTGAMNFGSTSTLFKSTTGEADFRIQNSTGRELFGVNSDNKTITIGSVVPDINGWSGGSAFQSPPDPSETSLIDFHSAVDGGDGYVYMIGGTDNFCSDTCYTVDNHLWSAPLNGDGTTGTWTDQGALPATDGNDASRHSLNVYGTHLYYVTSSVATENDDDRIYSSQLNGDGTTGTWTSVYDWTAASGLCETINPIGAPGLGSDACHFGVSIVEDDYLYIFIDAGNYRGVGNDGLVIVFSLNGSGGASASGTNNTLADDVYNDGIPTLPSVVAANNYLYVYNNYGTIYRASVNISTGVLTGWTANTADFAQSFDALAADGSYIYLLNGATQDGSTSYATLNAGTGAIGTWTLGDFMPEAGLSMTAFSDGSYLYGGGGNNPSTGYMHTDLFSAPLTSGYASPWGTAGSMIPPEPPIPPGIYGATNLVANGYLYAFGGDYDGSPTTRMQRNLLTGGFAPNNGWTHFSDLPVAMQDAAIARSGSYTYLIGGTGNTSVYYATTAGLSFSAVPTHTLAKILYGASATAMNSKLYVAGGRSTLTGGTYSDTAYYTTLNGNGTTNAWSSMGTLPQAIALSASASASNNYMYVIGGHNGTAAQSTVYYGSDTGSGISSWTTSSQPLPVALYGAKAVSTNGFIYVFGGKNASNNPVNTVYYAEVNADGSTTAWQTLGTLPSALYAPAVTVNGEYIYLVGGQTASESSPNTYYTSVQRMQTNVTGNLSTSGNLSTTGNLTVTGSVTGSGVASFQGADATVLTLNRTGSDGTLVSFQRNGTQQGSISVSGSTVSYNTFTGSHAALSEDDLKRGELVSQAGPAVYKEGSAEPIYTVKRSNAANDPNAFGSYFGRQESTDPVSKDNPELISAVGNGEMWVVDQGQDLRFSDNLVSSTVPGHAMKDPGTYGISHVVAKTAEAIDWDAVEAEIDGTKHKKISVLYSFYDKPSVQPVTEFETLTAADATITELKVEELAAVGELVVEGDAQVKGNLKVDGSLEIGADERGNGVEVQEGYDFLQVTFEEPRENADYNVQIQPNWLTITAVTGKTTEGFKVRFKEPTPADAIFDWLVIE